MVEVCGKVFEINIICLARKNPWGVI